MFSLQQNKQLIEIFDSFCTQYVSTFVKIKYIFSNYSALQAFLESGVRPMILNTKLSSALGSSPGEKSIKQSWELKETGLYTITKDIFENNQFIRIVGQTSNHPLPPSSQPGVKDLKKCCSGKL